jgi:hypothetical protein
MHDMLHDIQQFIDIRRKIHSYPELAFEEYLTAKTITDFLTQHAIEYVRIGDTGIVAKICRNKHNINIHNLKIWTPYLYKKAIILRMHLNIQVLCMHVGMMVMLQHYCVPHII